MPIGHYSFAGENPYQHAITEPGNRYSRESEVVSAKEPDRQSTARRGSSRGRSAMQSNYEEDDNQSSGRSSSQRGGSRGGTTQARRESERGNQTARRSA